MYAPVCFGMYCCLVCFEKRDKKRDKKRDINETNNETNKKFQKKNEAKPCQKKQALQKDFDKIAPSRPIILRGGISQQLKHWQQILETLLTPAAASTTEKSVSPLPRALDQKRKTETEKPTYDNISDPKHLSERQKRNAAKKAKWNKN